MGLVDLKDRLTRIAALRPAAQRVDPVAGDGPIEKIGERGGLERLVDGTIESNAAGTHLRVRSRHTDLVSRLFSRKVLGLICPGAPEEACDARSWLLLDTETTGLAGGTGTLAFLIGLGWWEEGAFIVEQLFMRSPLEEPSMLLALARRLEERDVLVTFNGKAFDWPLVETRFRMKRRPVPGLRAHIDLLHPARRIWQRCLGSARLAEIERGVLQLDRGPDIPSESIPRRYFDFLRHGRASPLAEVFRHNTLDLCGLGRLAGRIAAILEAPEEAAGPPLELFGLSRLLDARGEPSAAGNLYARALADGLPAEEDRSARRRLARLSRRSGDHQAACELWESLLQAGPFCMEAAEQLAIHYEHREKDPDQALHITRTALVRLEESARSGTVAPPAYRKLHQSLRYRTTRLERKAARKGEILS